MPESLHDQIDRERKAANPDVENIAVYRRYSEGDQDGALTADQKLLIGAAAKHSYADNVCDMILAAWSSRLVLTGWHVEDQAVRDFLDDLYVRNQLADLSYQINYATGRDGNHAVMLRWLPDDRASLPADPTDETAELPVTRSPGRVTVHPEPWWDGKTGIWVAYDDRGRPAYAVKDFEVVIDQPLGPPAKRKRRTVYFPDRIERYIEEGAGWRPYPLPGEPENAVVEWTKRGGSPLGIPVIHYAFRRFGRQRYGVSDLAGGVIANQDHINAIQQDIAAAAKLLGFQILTATGVDFERAPKLEPGTLLYTKKDAARFGAIPAGDISQLTQALETKLQTVARISSTPIHVIKGGDWPAGIALVQADKPAIIKAVKEAASMGPSHATLAHRSTEMANAFGNAGLNEDDLIVTRFADPEQLDQLAQAEVAKAKAEAQAALEMLEDEESLVAVGLTLEEARKRIAQRQANREAREAALERRFNAGLSRPAGRDDEEGAA